MRTIQIIALSMVLAGCASQTQPLVPTELPRVALPPDVAAIAEARIRQDLKDPNSAEFYDLVAYDWEGGHEVVVCGLVNAKNSYGGYNGRTPFIVIMKPPAPELPKGYVDGTIRDQGDLGGFNQLFPICAQSTG